MPMCLECGEREVVRKGYNCYPCWERSSINREVREWEQAYNDAHDLKAPTRLRENKRREVELKYKREHEKIS